jgi:hypothetical protein
MTRNIPAGIETAVRENCARAWNVFFRLNGVNLVFGLVALIRNGQQADAVNGRVGRAKPRSGEAHVVPGEVRGIANEKEDSERRYDTENQAGAG